jgi:hypothetical protein
MFIARPNLPPGGLATGLAEDAPASAFRNGQRSGRPTDSGSTIGDHLAIPRLDLALIYPGV